MFRWKSVVGLVAGIAGSVLSFGAWAAPIGSCAFDPAQMQFAGPPAEQASCLLRRVRPQGSGSDVQPVPQWLLERLNAPLGISAESLIAFLGREGVNAADLGGPIVAGDAAQRRYFVIHDTSSPEITATQFPADINASSYAGNQLSIWSGMVGQVNLVVTRDGRSRTLTDWKVERSISATKLEQKKLLPASKKVFVHVENVQPRRKPPGAYAWIAPTPAFTPSQLRRLALAYVTASLRAGRWLVPALHYNVDKGGPSGSANDDPQGFDLKVWVDTVQAVTEEVQAAPIEETSALFTAAPAGLHSDMANLGGSWPLAFRRPVRLRPWAGSFGICPAWRWETSASC